MKGHTKRTILKSHLTLRMLILLATASSMVASSPGETIRFDSDWKFLRSDQPGAEAAAFDDSSWRVLDVPHDWSIEDLPPKPDALPEQASPARSCCVPKRTDWSRR